MAPCRIAIQQLFLEDSQPRTPRQVIEALRRRFPGEWTDGTVRAQERVRDLVLQAYAEYEETATEAAS